MKLGRAEKTAAIAAICFVVLLAGFLIGKDSVSGVFTVTAARGGAYVPASAASPAQSAQAQPNQNTPAQSGETPADDKKIIFPIDINLATTYELTALPGIGESLAGRIIAYREENGAFSSIEEIMNVKGIGAARFSEIQDKIIVLEN